MSKPTESIHAPKLLELGFTKYVPPAHRQPLVYVVEETGESAEKAAASYSPQVEPPCFIQMGGLLNATMAIDETGQKWSILKAVDLEPFGFANALAIHPLQ